PKSHFLLSFRRVVMTRRAASAQPPKWSILLSLACSTFLGATGFALPQAAAGAPLTLEDALSRAMAANRTIAAARLQRAVDLAGVDVARERPNPELTYEDSKETPRQAIGATLPIELGGKRQRRV